ncbi:Apc15p protein-domain-containing protein [Aspergillus crustosus]
MISLPLFTPRDSHDLWFHPRSTPNPSHTHDPTTNTTFISASHAQAQAQARRQNTTQYRNGSSTSHPGGLGLSDPNDTLATLILEERALRARKNNIASFGCSWIKPAGCPKTMMGMNEEEAEREEAMAAADAEYAAAAAAAGAERAEGEEEGEDETGMGRDLDADIPDAEGDEEEGEGIDGLVEDGEEGLEDEGVDEEGYMERDLDDDVPEAFADYEDDDDDDELDENDEGDFDNQPDLDDEIPSADDGMDDISDLEQEEEGGGEHERDPDADIPEAEAGEEEEWQHTDTDAEFDDEEDDVSFSQHPFRTSTASSTRGLPRAPPHPHPREAGRETEAQRRFLQRWSGGGDTFDTSTMSMSMMVDEYDQTHDQDHGRELRASMASQTSRRSSGGASVFSRFPRQRGRTRLPRDSLEY